MKILAFAASGSRNPINRNLVRAAAELLPGSEIELIDLKDYEIPIFSIDRDAANGVHPFARKIMVQFSKNKDRNRLRKVD